MSEVVNNGTNNVNEANQQQVQQPATAPVQQQPQTVVQTNVPAPTVVEEQKPNWFKRNWKKVAAGSAAILTAVGSAIVAYQKGKRAGGMNCCAQDDGSVSPLDPNVE